MVLLMVVKMEIQLHLPKMNITRSWWVSIVDDSLLQLYKVMLECGFYVGLRIAQHDKVQHFIAHRLQANRFSRFFTLVNVSTTNNKSSNSMMSVMATPLAPTTTHHVNDIKTWAWHHMHNRSQTPLTPSPLLTSKFMEFTYCCGNHMEYGYCKHTYEI